MKETVFKQTVKEIIDYHLSNRLMKWKNDSDQLDSYELFKYELPYVYYMCKDIHLLFTNNVTLKQISVADSMASGHIDYYSKFQLYCLELFKKKKFFL